MSRFLILTTTAWTLMLAIIGVGLQAAEGTEQVQRTTITGVAHGLTNLTAKMDPQVANATVTVSGPGGVTTVYYVHGWAGVLIAQRAEGKSVEVTGVVGSADGKSTIVARSIDVAIDGKPIEEKPQTPNKPSPVEPSRVTITGVAKGIGDPNGKMDPMAANATVTTADGTVYEVHGWAGIIITKQANGKTVEVTGTVGGTAEKKSILGRSIDVAINGVPIEGKPKH